MVGVLGAGRGLSRLVEGPERKTLKVSSVDSEPAAPGFKLDPAWGEGGERGENRGWEDEWVSGVGEGKIRGAA